MRKSWWKILGAVILTYTFIAGLLVPLKPGIYDVNPGKAETGTSFQLSVEGYNTMYTSEAEKTRVWLKMSDEMAIQAKSVTVIDDTHLTAAFDIPPYIPIEKERINCSILVDHKTSGASVSPDAFVIRQTTPTPPPSNSFSNNKITDLHITGDFNFPFRGILYETIRNTYYHVPLWLAMMILFIASVYQSFKYLLYGKPSDDWKAMSLTAVGTLYGMLGLVTGMIWAKHTWGTYWTWEEVKLNMTAIALLIYLAYFILRGSLDDEEKKGRISAVYNIFAFAALIPLLYVVPRMTSSLHPGNGGNPALAAGDLDHTMKMIFYPAVIGWTLLGVWIGSLFYRALALKERIFEKEFDS